MSSSRPAISRPIPATAKYFYSSQKVAGTAPSTRVDISDALNDLLAQIDNRDASGPTRESEEHAEPISASEAGSGENTESKPKSGKEKKREARKDKKQSKQQQQQRSEGSDVANVGKPPARTPFWFEKYIWFLSSDGYLVLTSRYSHQTALLLTRHLKSKDIIVSADVPGASLVVVKNYLQNAEVVPPSTLAQASMLSISTSVAWDTNGFVQGWWARSSAVKVKTNVEESLRSLSALEGQKKEDAIELELEINIDPKMKNSIGPVPLIMGFGFLFLVDDESAARHTRPLSVADLSLESEEEKTEPQEEDGNQFDGETDRNDDESASSMSEQDGDSEEDDMSDAATDEDDEVSARSSALSRTESTASSSPAPTAIPHGTKSKLKKISLKYADQDEEERAIRMALLGSGNAASRKQELEQARQARRQAREAEEQAQRKAEAEAKLKNRDRRKEATESQRVPLRADVLLVYDEGEEEEIVPRQKMVSRPSREDNVIAAVPICAPWPALHKVKYKVRLLPGVGKRGKTLKKCQEWFMRGMGGQPDKSEMDTDRAWPKEIRLIGALTDAEIALPVGVQKFRAAIPSANSAGGKLPKSSSGKKGSGASAGSSRAEQSQKGSKGGKSKKGKK
ncbi:hypothetical protein BZA70DRAFT_280346 [Myxozyma melibiosi]|uniref:NFACT RNA-binding domain-containing protein n=1 Tax=Myxozyma melibiosi TaxID=54550 RepID=A0ABR1F547_9ASCO